MTDQSNERPTRNSFASVIANAGTYMRGLFISPDPGNSNVATVPSTSPSTSLSTGRQPEPITAPPFSQVANHAIHRFVAASPSSHTAPNSINPSHMRTIELLIAEITALRDQLPNANPTETTAQQPIPIHAPPVGENLL